MNLSTKMLCLVRQPNAVILEVECDQKAKGQECLDKVCQMLGIIEVDYFGLQYAGQHGEMLWLNMRNPIKQQLTGANAPPFRFQLKVKFFVPPHLLLQEVTRHQFYISIVKDLQEGRLRVNDKQLAVKLSALIAQSEIGDLDTEVVTSALLTYRKWIPHSILENELMAGSPTMQRKGKRRKHHSGSSEPDVSSESEELTSDTDSCWTMSTINYLINSSDFSCLTNSVIQCHQKFEGTKPTHAKYLFLQEVANLDDIGVEYFYVKLNNNLEDPYRIGVGPKGVTVISEESNEIKYNILYSSIHMATHSGRCFFLTHIESNGESQALGFKLESGLAANAIYRAVTEKHAFYSCETVRNAVTTQFIRDLKGTIVSLFNENTTLGKNYVFDIRRTFREVYDHTRRELYQLEAITNESNQSEDAKEMVNNEFCLELDHSGSDSTLCKKSHCRHVKDRLATLQDSMLCRICFDNEVCTAFNCGHVVCCESCAPLCDRCPLCRRPVLTIQRIYLPLSRNGLNQTNCDNTKC